MKIRFLPTGLILAVTLAMSAASGAVPAMAESTGSESSTEASADISTETAAEEEPEDTNKDTDKNTDTESADTEAADDADNKEAADTQTPADATPNSLVQDADAAPGKSDIRSSLGNEDYVFEETDQKAYLISDGSIVEEPEDGAQKIADVSKYDTVELTGTNDRKYWEVLYDGEVEYIDKSLITTDQTVINKMKQEEEKEAKAKIEAESDRIQAKVEALSADSKADREEAEDLIEKIVKEEKEEDLKKQTKNSDWNGPVLSKSAGKIKGPSGNETYYNLNMSGVISTMRRMGNNDEYWVRDDGCKMLGDYIMCAANLKIHPRGSLVESSLGTCIVCDTGGFVSYDSTRLDIATTW